MTDIEVFKKFMGWMQMEICKEKVMENGNTVLYFEDSNKQDTELFTKWGYDSFLAGIIFDTEGKMVKGYIDSHVAHSSDNAKLINEIVGY